MRTIYHPTLPGVTREVANPDEWKAQGWRLTEPGQREAGDEMETPLPTAKRKKDADTGD